MTSPRTTAGTTREDVLRDDLHLYTIGLPWLCKLLNEAEEEEKKAHWAEQRDKSLRRISEIKRELATLAAE
tara:strand:- start:361 stop:573 length:213 start_codon:yes stop_codon:yes gene_type:complete